jgi:hypothetical protein
MEFFQQTYTALRGPTGVQQTPADTITRLSDRLSPSTLLADRRAAVLSLKGLARAHKQLVGAHAMQGLLLIIQTDADIDPDIGRAAIETVAVLCDALDVAADYALRDVGLEHTDRLLEDEKTAHALFALLAGDRENALRYSACVLLTSLLQNRPQRVQTYFLKAPIGHAPVIALLEGEKEIVSHGEPLHLPSYYVPNISPFFQPSQCLRRSRDKALKYKRFSHLMASLRSFFRSSPEKVGSKVHQWSPMLSDA